MRSDQHTRSVVLGIFILTALVIFSLGLFVLGGRHSTFGKSILLKSDFSDVTGLKRGSNVLFGGVKVGIVKNIELQPGNRVAVLMQIEKDKQQFIGQDAVVRLGNDGLVGSKILEIQGGNPQLGAVPDGAVLASEQGSSLHSLFGTLKTNNDNLAEITTDLKQITRQMVNGEGTIGKLFSSDALATSIETLVKKLHLSANQAQTITSDVAAFTAQLDQPGSIPYQLMHDTVIFSRLRSASRQLDQMAENAQTLIKKINRNTDALNDTSKPAGMILHDEKTARELKNIIQNLQSGTQKLNETLDALRHNFLLRGAFRRMEEEKKGGE